MKFKNHDNCKNTITIKRSIFVNDNLKKFIFENSNYRRKVWNDFVEEYYNCKKSGTPFDSLKFKSKYFNEKEVPEGVYNKYVTGISEQVMKDIDSAIKSMKCTNGTLRFKSFDRFKCSFKVHCKPTYRKRIEPFLPHFVSKVYIDSDDQITFSIRRGEKIYINLKEPLWKDVEIVNGTVYYIDKHFKFAFSEEDIKTISFCHELGKFYICLTVKVLNIYMKKYESRKRYSYCGIDLGIHNPICITDETNSYILRMSQRELSRIYYLERRISKLQNILSTKTYLSNNYFKLLHKIRVSWYKIKCIRLNWRRHVSKFIATRYKHICVDTYRIPDNTDNIKIPRNRIKYINSINRCHAMFEFSKNLEHICDVYKTKYTHSPENTTRTCNACGHVNDKLYISQRYLKCKQCGCIIDRDINASKNCYDYICNS